MIVPKETAMAAIPAAETRARRPVRFMRMLPFECGWARLARE
jgi:hypothetical protein